MEYTRRVLHVGGALAVFACLFLTIFWIPGILLGLFAVVYLADSPNVALDPELRRAHNRLAARRHRRGWIDSTRAA